MNDIDALRQQLESKAPPVESAPDAPARQLPQSNGPQANASTLALREAPRDVGTPEQPPMELKTRSSGQGHSDAAVELLAEYGGQVVRIWHGRLPGDAGQVVVTAVEGRQQMAAEIASLHGLRLVRMDG